MHELSLVATILAEAEAEVSARGASRVRRICLRIGSTSGVDPALLWATYRRCRTSTLCENAELEVEIVPARWVCPVCGDLPEPPAGSLACPTCGDPLRLVAGEELILDRIHLETGDG